MAKHGWALCLPTFSHFLIVNETSLCLCLSPLHPLSARSFASYIAMWGFQ